MTITSYTNNGKKKSKVNTINTPERGSTIDPCLVLPPSSSIIINLLSSAPLFVPLENRSFPLSLYVVDSGDLQISAYHGVVSFLHFPPCRLLHPPWLKPGITTTAVTVRPRTRPTSNQNMPHISAPGPLPTLTAPSVCLSSAVVQEAIPPPRLLHASHRVLP